MLEREIKKIIIQLSLKLLVYSALFHKMNIAVNIRSIAITFKHKKQLMNLQKKHQGHEKQLQFMFSKRLYIIFFLYEL